MLLEKSSLNLIHSLTTSSFIIFKILFIFRHKSLFQLIFGLFKGLVADLIILLTDLQCFLIFIIVVLTSIYFIDLKLSFTILVVQ